MSGNQKFGAGLGHRPQGLGPFARIALNLGRIAGVGHRPDYEIPRQQELSRRYVYPAMIIGLAARMMALKFETARYGIELMIEVGIRIGILSRPFDRTAELPAVEIGR